MCVCVCVCMHAHACALSCFRHVQLFETLWTIACQNPLPMGFSRQEYWSGPALPTPGNLPHPGIKPASPALPLTYQLFSHSVVSDSVTPWTAARQASLLITNSQNLLKLMSIPSVMPSNHLILCCLLLLPSVFPSIKVFFN